MIQLLFLIVALAFADIEQQGIVSGVYTAVASNHELRAFAAQYNSIDNNFVAAGARFTVDPSGSTSGSATLEAAAFKFCGGQYLVSEPSVGFSMLGVNVNYTFTPNNQGGQFLYSVIGAIAELGISFNGIFLYKERNGVPGFQYQPGDNVWNCLNNNGKDCIVTNSYFNFKNDFTWSAISLNWDYCSNILSSTAGYNNTCKIFQLSTTGSYGIPLVGSVNVITIKLTLASQKVNFQQTATVGGSTIEIGPDVAKFDIEITYPWAGRPLIDRSTSNVALLAGAAGKAGSAVVAGGVWRGKSASVWYGDGGKAAVLSWDGTATVKTQSNPTGSDEPVYVQGISGESLLAYNCTQTPAGCVLEDYTVVLGWQILAGTLKLLGWTPELAILSWDVPGPTQVVHDPVYGTAASTDIKGSGMLIAPSMFLYFFWVLVQYFYRR